MATAVEPKATTWEPEQRVLLPGVGWEGYETILNLVGDGHVRLTYDRRDLELMSPSRDHEVFKSLIARLIETLTLELDLPCEAVGSTTWRKKLKEGGLEPDECYDLANSERFLSRKNIDLNVDPPPDLAIEIEISRSALDRMGVYARLGVPEVWRFDGEMLRIAELLADGSYADVPASPGLPFFSPDEAVRWIRLAEGQGQTPWLRQFREGVRNELAPRIENRP
jgi:Uma2 family endonuclease